MPVLDMLCRDPRLTRVTLIEPDVYKPHNVERHLFPLAAVGERKAELAQRWLQERRPDLEVELLLCDLLDPAAEADIERAAAAADIGALHALVTLGLLANPTGYAPGFTSLLLTLQQVPEVFDEAFRPYRFRVPRAAECLICQPGPPQGPAACSSEDLDVALDQALA